MQNNQLEDLLTCHYEHLGYHQELVQLWRGDPEPMMAFIARRPDLCAMSWTCLRYEISLLAGRPVGRVVERVRHHPMPNSWSRDLYGRYGSFAGGDTSFVEDPVEIGDTILGVLRDPYNVETHRAGIVALLDRIATNAFLPQEPSYDANCVALHHTELATHVGEQFEHDWPPRHEVELTVHLGWPAVSHLPEILCDPDRFHQHLLAGLDSPSESRRGLSVRLLSLSGLPL